MTMARAGLVWDSQSSGLSISPQAYHKRGACHSATLPSPWAVEAPSWARKRCAWTELVWL